MPIKMITNIIQCDDIEEMESVLHSMGDKLAFFSRKHSDFNYKLEPNFDKHEIVVKTCRMMEAVN